MPISDDIKKSMNNDHEVVRIALTGGPCAGKTTALAALSEWLTDLGFVVVVSPEVATTMFSNGVSVESLSPSQVIDVQLAMLKFMIASEEAFVAAARAMSNGRKTVLICDRGRVDSKAYMSEVGWIDFLKGSGHSMSDLRDSPYEAVFAITTAADGAVEHYTKENNAARRETAEEAVAADRRTKAAWIGHPHFRVIENTSRGMAGKIRDLKAGIARVLGVPEPLEIERKFLVSSIDETKIPKEAVTVRIEQTYLDDGWRVRKREGLYTLTYKTDRSDGLPGRVEVERKISKEEYERLLTQQLPGTETIVKDRTLFVHGGRYLELDRFITGSRPGMAVLEVELDDIDDPVSIPSWITVEREVTDDARYLNERLAKTNSKRGKIA